MGTTAPRMAVGLSQPPLETLAYFIMGVFDECCVGRCSPYIDEGDLHPYQKAMSNVQLL